MSPKKKDIRYCIPIIVKTLHTWGSFNFTKAGKVQSIYIIPCWLTKKSLILLLSLHLSLIFTSAPALDSETCTSFLYKKDSDLVIEFARLLFVSLVCCVVMMVTRLLFLLFLYTTDTNWSFLWEQWYYNIYVACPSKYWKQEMQPRDDY